METMAQLGLNLISGFAGGLALVALFYFKPGIIRQSIERGAALEVRVTNLEDRVSKLEK